MANLYKIFSVYFICSLLISIVHTLPLDDEKISPQKDNSSSRETSMRFNNDKIELVASSQNLSKDPNQEISNKKEATTIRPSSVKVDSSKIIADGKQKNIKDFGSLTNSTESSSNESSKNTGIQKELIKNEQLNKSFPSLLSSQTSTKIHSLNPDTIKDEEEKDKTNQDETNIKSEPKNGTTKNIEPNDSKFKKSKSSQELTKEEPKSKDIDQPVKDKESSTKNKFEGSTDGMKLKDQDSQLAPANDDIAYKLNVGDDSNEKQINKPEISNYSDKNKGSFFDKGDGYGYDGEDDDDTDKFRENFSKNKQQKVETSNAQHPYIPNKALEMADDANSHFFAYLLTVMVMAVLFYLLFHNKQRIIALMIEGRGARPSRRGSARAKYHKLDNNLEEAMGSMRGEGTSSGGLSNVY